MDGASVISSVDAKAMQEVIAGIVVVVVETKGCSRYARSWDRDGLGGAGTL